MNKFYFCFFLLIFLTAQSQNLKTPYEIKVDEISTKAFKTIGVSESLILKAKKNNDWEIVLKSNEFFNITRNSNQENLKIWVLAYSSALKEAEKLKNSKDFEKDKLKKDKKKTEIAEREYINSDENILKNSISNDFQKWLKKGEFEKQNDWEIRINSEYEKAFNEICRENFEERININNLYNYEIRLDSYDSEKEIFPIKILKRISSNSSKFVTGSVNVPINKAEKFKEYIGKKISFNILETEWRFDDHNLFPQKTNIEVLGDNYTIDSNTENSDNTTISSSNLKLENTSNREMVFNFNNFNKLIIEKEASKKEVQKIEEEKKELNQNPEFPGGISSFRRKMMANIDTEIINFEGKITTILHFTVDINGELKNIEAIGNNQTFNDEAVKTVKSIKTKWIPAKKNGIVIESTLSIPLSMSNQ